MGFEPLLDYRAVSAGKTTCAALVEEALLRAKNAAHLNLFIELFEESVRAQAQDVDRRLAAGETLPLAGMVVALKDNLCYRGHGVSAGSKMLESFESLFSATAVERLEAAGALFLGRTNCDEFAMGSSNETSHYGPVRNPLDPTKVPGGSSGGSAAAVAAGVCHVALGSDTGGSIRQPAAFTGIVGMKPTYGRISRHGLIAYASSFDQIGPFAHTLEDAAAALEVMAGADAFDATVSSRPVDPIHVAPPVGPQRYAYFQATLDHPGLDPHVRSSMEALFDQLRADGHTVEAVDFPYLDQLVPLYYVLTTAEASANLARYDGVRFGHRSAVEADDLDTLIKASRSEGFGLEVQRRILLGTFVLSSGYYDAYYGQAQKGRRLLRDHADSVLTQFDALLSPTSPHTAFPIGREDADPTVMYLEDLYTVHANLTGLPALSLPGGTHPNGLPWGMHVTTGRFCESALFEHAALLRNALRD
jgi:aspartyl-tRNA(Asn)/glutamyl-tRNA(Gln) amidotransferase subunit A